MGVILLACSTGCRKGGAKGGQEVCYLLILPKNAPVGVPVSYRGNQIGWPIERAGRHHNEYQAGVGHGHTKVPEDRPISLACIPPSTWLSKKGKWSLELQTPCGQKTLTAHPGRPFSREDEERAREESARSSRQRPVVFLDFDDAPSSLSQTNVWYVPPAKGGGGTKIAIGKAELKLRADYDPTRQETKPLPLFDLGCKDELAVLVDGKPHATLKVPAPPPKGLIINGRGGCLRLQEVVYKHFDPDLPVGDGLGAGWSHRLKGPLIKLTHIWRIDYFLRSAPTSKSKAKTVIQLLPATCPKKE